LRSDDVIDNYYVNDIASTTSASLDSATLTASAQPFSATGGAEPTLTGDVTRGLVSKWALDGDALDSEGANDGTASNVTYTGGYIDQSGSFDASNSIIDCGNDASLNQPSWTYATWVNLDATSTGTTDIRTIAAKNVEAQDRMFWIVSWDGEWQARVGSNSQTVNGGPSATGTWTHLALRYDGGTGTFELFVDGVLKDTNTELDVGGQGSSLKIGSESANYRVFDGLIDESRMYDVVLTDQEIADLVAYDGSTATTLSVVTNVGSIDVSGLGSGLSPGSAPLIADGGAVTARTGASGITPGLVSTTATAADLAVSDRVVSVSQSGIIISPDPALVGSVGATPGVLAGSVSVGGETAQITPSAAPFSITPRTIQVISDATTGTLAAPGSILLPGPVSASVESGSGSVTSQSPSAIPGPGVVIGEIGSVSISALQAVWSAGGSIFADPATGTLFAGDESVVPGPVSTSVDSVLVETSVVDPEAVPVLITVTSDRGSASVLGSSVGVLPRSISIGVDRGDVLSSSQTPAFSPGSTSVNPDVAGLVASIPQEWGLTPTQVRRIVELLGIAETEYSVSAALAADTSLLSRVRKNRETIIRFR
jgi:hypothetical protein